MYHGTRRLLKEIMLSLGIKMSEADMTNPDCVQEAIRPDTKLLWIETPSNPRLFITDIRSVTDIARKNNIIAVADNTWPSPLNQNPFESGVDLVVHSATKYLGGHSDILAGAVVSPTNSEIFKIIRNIQISAGAVPSPGDCWLLIRSIKTLPVRIRTHNENAEKVASFLKGHPKIVHVYYPGFKEHPGHDIAKRQMMGFGGMISFEVKGGEDEAKRVVFSSELISPATSLGGVESTWEHRLSSEGPDSQTPANLIRLSTGLEHYQDLITDIENALNKI